MAKKNPRKEKLEQLRLENNDVSLLILVRKYVEKLEKQDDRTR
jgi:hypothetical protein